MTFQSLNKLFFDRAEQYNEKPFLWAKKDKEWIPLTWNETSLKVKEFAGGLRSLGIKPGDKVVIVSENRPNEIPKLCMCVISRKGVIFINLYKSI